MSTTQASARHYAAADFTACLKVFDTNVPRFFRAEERADFTTFLRKLPGPYYVLVGASGDILGCGGYALRAEAGVADLCWGMVRQEHQGVGLGRMLAELRVNEIRGEPHVSAIALKTSQLTTGFYERLGFRTTRIEPNGFAEGLDRCEMLLDLNAPQSEPRDARRKRLP